MKKNLTAINMVILISLIAFNQLHSQTCTTCTGNEVTGIQSSALGFGNTVNGDYSTSIGRNSQILNTPQLYPSIYSNILGSWSKIENGPHSIVLGSFSQALNDFSFVLGPYAKAKGSYSFALGSHVEAWSGGSFVIGGGKIDAKLTNNMPNSLMIGFNSQYPTLFVSETPSNKQSGRVGIGNVTNPQAKLHIRADDGEEASLRLEPSGSAYNAVVYFTNSGHAVKAKTGGHLTFNTQSTKGFVFEAGNVGIGNTNPEAKLQISGGDVYIEDINQGIIMKSPNGQCWRGTLTDQGTLNFAQTTCPEGTSNAAQSQNSEKLMLVYPNPASYKLTVETRLSGRQGTLSVLTTTGFRLSEQPVNTGKTIVQLEAYAAGTYILQLEVDGKVVESTKFVKK